MLGWLPSLMLEDQPILTDAPALGPCDVQAGKPLPAFAGR